MQPLFQPDPQLPPIQAFHSLHMVDGRYSALEAPRDNLPIGSFATPPFRQPTLRSITPRNIERIIFGCVVWDLETWASGAAIEFILQGTSLTRL